jgi:signal transduction histidine kinase
MLKLLNFNLIIDENDQLFVKFLFCVWLTTFFYSCFYYFIGAFFSLIIVTVGTLILNPIVFILMKNKFKRSSRLMFLFNCSVYIFGTNLGLGNLVNNEYYYFPAVLLAFLIIDSKNKRDLIFGISLPIMFWILSMTIKTSLVPEKLMLANYNYDILIFINFVGAFLLTCIFSFIFIKTIEEHRKILVANAKMSSLGEMASGVAHEINNPLFILSGITEQMKRKNFNEDYTLESRFNDLSKIDKSVERIIKIVRGLKVFSRNSENDPFEKTSIKEIFLDTLEICNEKIKNLDIKFIVDYSEDISIVCKSTQISQVFINLIGNSCDAIALLDVKWIEFKAERKDNTVVISVKDSGGGISSEVIDKMMQPFFTTKVAGKGTGLGLSISKRIIKEHNGKLYYDKMSTNTKFVIELPIA